MYDVCGVVMAMAVGESRRGWVRKAMRCEDDVQVQVRSETNSEMHYDDGPRAATVRTPTVSTLM